MGLYFRISLPPPPDQRASAKLSFDDIFILPELRTVSMVQDLKWPSGYVIYWPQPCSSVSSFTNLLSCPCEHKHGDGFLTISSTIMMISTSSAPLSPLPLPSSRHCRHCLHQSCCCHNTFTRHPIFLGPFYLTPTLTFTLPEFHS